MRPRSTAAVQIVRAKRQVALSPLIFGAIALLLAGCESYPESHVVSAPPPPAPNNMVVTTAQPGQTVVVASSAQPQAGTPVIVMQAPPAMQPEMVTVQPSSAHKWVPGYWSWHNERYEWVTGHWELPPNSGATWVAPRWERLSDGTYRFYEGYWN